LVRLLALHPPDKLDADGRLFWSGFRRLPKVLELDCDDSQHLEFVLSTANLLAYGFGLHAHPEVPLSHSYRNKEFIKEVVLRTPRPTVDTSKVDGIVDEEEVKLMCIWLGLLAMRGCMLAWAGENGGSQQGECG
jgi:hypothetical protein